ncbi:MAG: helicase-related protein [Actinomycetota bacterium]|nr:helicase-related protein [Actinomycetota bacterium]
MAVELSELKAGLRLRGLVAAGEVTVVAVEPHGDGIANVVYRADDGQIGDRLVTTADATGFEVATGARWSFDAPGEGFKLASEARRIQLAHLFDPFAAISTATIQPLPHQIEAVYGRLLPLQPLHFLLADDPGAGKTIMSGLYIRELMLRGDLERCLIVAPGSLVEQWQEELDLKFNLHFDVLSRDMVEAARTGNPFQERNLLIARLDQLSRSPELQAKLAVSDWDLVIFDEAHKLSAHLYGEEVKRTLRFELAEQVRDHTRNLLLLTATPHNGSNDDFLLFLSILDPDRFTGRLRGGKKLPDVNDLMRRYVKESLLTFDGKRLFRERKATTVNYDLSPEEEHLYEAVTSYVQDGMGKAQALTEGGDKRRGLAVGFALAALQRRLASSPEAIFQSLKRRREKLAAQLLLAQKAGRVVANPVPMNGRLADPDGLDADDFEDDEFEDIEDEAIENAWTAESLLELEREVNELQMLETMAARVRASDTDKKWIELRTILHSDEFRSPGDGRKLIVFTEHRDTLNYLERKISTVLGDHDAVVSIHGGVRREERRRIQDLFRNDPKVKVLVATDAAGEGVNLQRANLMVNYDLPWNPNRIEQRFGRIHRIGQTQVCHLWNLVAHGTREGKVFERLFAKIEQQRALYGDQIYDVLGDAQINKSLQDLLLQAIQYGKDPAVLARVDEVIDAEIGNRLKTVLDERALASNVLDATSISSIRHQMEMALARKLAPGFIQAFFTAALDDLGGRIAPRETGRFEVTRVPAIVRSKEREAAIGGPVQTVYERVTFDKDRVAIGDDQLRAELVTPGHPLLAAVLDTILDRYGDTLSTGTTLVDPTDDSDTVRVLVYLEHTITDGRLTAGARKVVSRRFQFVEILHDGTILDPGAEPYLNYAPITAEAQHLLVGVDNRWASDGLDRVARSWATAQLATPHYDEIAHVTKARIERVRVAVDERLNSEIRYWDARAAELKQQELQGKKTRLSSGRARQRADELEARKARRLRELDIEADLMNHAPTIVGAALVIPQGLLDRLAGSTKPVIDQAVIEETDSVAIAAVMVAERRLGREPEEQDHNNPGFDILSTDQVTGIVYQIEVKGHRPANTEIKVRARQVRQAKMNPERFRLAIVSVPHNPAVEPAKVHYLIRPFDTYEPHFAQTYLPLDVEALLEHAVEPQ